MAIIKCPECGRERSSEAPICPYCGYSFLYSITDRQRAMNNLIFLIAGCVFCLITREWFTRIILIGAVFEFLYASIGTLLALLFRSRMIRHIRYMLVFDLGFLIGGLIGIFI